MRLIKRYSNRKLYDTATRTYITLEGVAGLVQEGAEIKVVDNETDEDLTTVILSQLLLERERSRRSLSSGLLSGLLRSGETLGRGLSSLARPLPLSSSGLVGMLEHEVERSLKFWLEMGQGSEEEILRMVERLIENRRKARPAANLPEVSRPAVPGPGLLRRRSLDDFEVWDDATSDQPPPFSPLPIAEQATDLARQAAQLAEHLQQNPPDPAIARQLQADLNEISERLAKWGKAAFQSTEAD